MYSGFAGMVNRTVLPPLTAPAVAAICSLTLSLRSVLPKAAEPSQLLPSSMPRYVRAKPRWPG